jgi:hypothetical protein
MPGRKRNNREANGDDGSHIFFSAKEKKQGQLTSAQEAERALAAIREACGRHGGKSFDLYWLGRRGVQAVLDAGPSHPSHAGVVAALEDHPEEAEKIADGDSWEHGFHAGVVAFSRLVNSLATTEWQDFTGNTDDPEHPWLSPKGARTGAEEEWPMLDS